MMRHELWWRTTAFLKGRGVVKETAPKAPT
jgi:hypothetical protein